MSRGALLLLAVAACAAPQPGAIATDWKPLLDLTSGDPLAGWQVAAIGGGGKVELVDGRLELGQGSPMTGVTYRGDFPRDDYELELDATRRLGTDFFCGLTFPVGAQALTLVLGGWGGGLCGLSCLDGRDASDNETKSFQRFDRGRRFHVLLRVAGGRVQAWLDGAPLVDVDVRGRRLSLRPEVEQCQPLGIATYATLGVIENVRWRPVSRRA